MGLNTRYEIPVREIILQDQHPDETFAFQGAWFEWKLSEYLDFIEETCLIPDLKSYGVIKDDGTFYSDEDEASYTVILDAITQAVYWIHDTYYSQYHRTDAQTGIDYKYIPFEILQEATRTPCRLSSTLNLIGDIKLENLGRYRTTPKIVELTDYPDPETGFIYFNRDWEISRVQFTKYLYEPLANLQYRATAAGSYTYRQILSAYAELKGAMYDSLNRRLVNMRDVLCPAEDLYPETDLYPEDVSGDMGDSIYLDSPSAIRKLSVDMFAGLLKFGSVEVETPEGWIVGETWDPDGEVYKLSNEITKHFAMSPDDLARAVSKVTVTLFDLIIRNVSAEIISIPWAQICDYLSVNHADWPGPILMYDHRIKGIQGAKDTVENKIK
jgi:hypothetical protein